MATRTKPAAPPAAKPAGPPGGLSPLELHALASVTKDARKWRELLAAGDGQEVDFVVWVKGRVNVGDEQSANVKDGPDVEDLLALALSQLGEKTRQKVFEALADPSTPLDSPAVTDQARAMAKAAIDARTTSHEQTKNGNVTAFVTVGRLP